MSQTGVEAGIRRWRIGDGALRRAPFANGPAVRIVVGAAEAPPLAVLEVTIPVGGAMPAHDHGNSAVLLVPQAGRLRLVEADAPDRVTELEAGAVATIAVGLRVRLENAGAVEARTLVVLSPPDFAEHLEAWPAENPATVG